jgi:hypothetical protein
MIGARNQIDLWSIVRTNAILPSPNRIRNVETGDLRASLAYDCGLGILAGTSQTQYAAASARTRRDQALHGGMSQMVEGQLLIKHEGGQFAASRFQIRQECRPVFLNGSEEQGRFGAVALVRDRACDRAGVTACCCLRGKHQMELSAAGRN